jgi:hypothetical protein
VSRADREELRALRARVASLEVERRYREPFPWEDLAVLACLVPVVVAMLVLLFSIVERVLLFSIVERVLS